MNYVKKTVKELIAINTNEKVFDFIKELCLHTENRMLLTDEEIRGLIKKYYKNERVSYSSGIDNYVAKVMSWIDCLEFLQNHLEGKIKSYDVKLCFEYHTPDNNWLDVVALDDDRITILEFKSGENIEVKTLIEYEEQIDHYCCKMTHANRNIWQKFERGLTSRGFLVFTNEKMKNVKFKNKNVKVCDEFEEIADDFSGYMDDKYEHEVMNFNQDLDSSTLTSFVNVLNGQKLDKIYISESCKKRCVEIIDCEKKDDVPKVNIILINGKPGSGKTGVALSLITEYMQRRVNGESDLRVRYATGNRNLYSLLNKAVESEETTGTTSFVFSRISDLYDIQHIIDAFKKKNKITSKTKEDIIIIDEAQRMWSSERMAFDKNMSDIEEKRIILRKDLSEPALVLIDIYESAIESSSEKTIIFLIGNGQEIYKGEELGENQIINAVKKIASFLEDRVKTKVYSSKKYEMLSDKIQDNYEGNDNLYLKTEKRNMICSDIGELVNSMLLNKISYTDSKDAFQVVDSKEEFDDRYLAIYLGKQKWNENDTQRYLISSYDDFYDASNDDPYEDRYGESCENAMEYYFGRKMIRIKDEDDKLVEFYSGNKKFEFNYYATEFDVQGLEVDYAFLYWGNTLTIKNNRWCIDAERTKGLDRYYENIEKFKIKNPDIPVKSYDINKEKEKIIINAYRVLLTRARKKTIIYVEDENTRQYLKKMLCECETE